VVIRGRSEGDAAQARALDGCSGVCDEGAFEAKEHAGLPAICTHGGARLSWP